MSQYLRNGDSRKRAWIEQIAPCPGAADSGVWIEYAYWRGGAELRARTRDRDGPVATEGTIPFYWLTSQHLEVQGQAMRFLKKVTEAEARAKVQADVDHTAWRESHPALAEYMEADAWPDGSARKTSTLLVFIEQGAVKGCLNDRDGGRSLWATAGSLAGLLEALEAMLATGGGEWRQSSYGTPPHKSPKGRR